MNRHADWGKFLPWGAGLLTLVLGAPALTAAEPSLEPVQTIVLKGKAGRDRLKGKSGNDVRIVCSSS